MRNQISTGQLPRQSESSPKRTQGTFKGNHRRAQSCDEKPSLQRDSKSSSRSLSWLPNARRRRSMTPAPLRHDNSRGPYGNKDYSCSRLGKHHAHGGSASSKSRSRKPAAEHHVQRMPNLQHAHSLCEQDVGRASEETMDRSFSPFSESGVALMPNGHLQRLVVTPDSQQQSWTESVYTLIQETEEAFKSVGDSLKDDTGPNSWFADPSESISSSVAEIHPEHSHPDSSGHHELGQSTPPKRIQVSPLNKPLPPHPENRKEKVVPAKKTKRKEPKKKTVLPLCGLPGTGSSSKWTMRNGVSQILSGTLFKRVEADEMLTSDQIDQIRTRRLQVRDNKHSSFDGRSWMDCARSVRSQSPALHRNGAQAGVVSQRANSPTSPLDNAVVHKDFSSPEKSYGESEQVCEGQDQQGDAALSPNNAAASSPPPKNPEKHFYNNKSRAKLPTIPEATITAAGGTVGRTSGAVSARSDSSLAPVCRTGTSPSGVRSSPHHGRTACGKAEASTDDRDDAPEDSVDKTSFQVATLCIEDDLKEALYEYDGEESETEEELVDWFENLGIPHGDLVSDRASPPWNSPSYSVDSRFTSKVGSDKNPLLRKPSEKHRPLPAEPMRFFTNRSPPRKWTPENLSPDRYTLRAAVRGTFRPTADRLYI